MMSMIKQKRTLVLMAGFGGSGKTTLAYALGKQLAWPIIDKDVLKATIISTLPELPIAKVNALAYEVLFTLARDYMLIQQLSIIIDTSAIYPSMSEFAQDLAQQANAQLKILLCKAGPHIRRQRLEYRNMLDAGQRQPVVDTLMWPEDDWQLFDHLPLEH